MIRCILPSMTPRYDYSHCRVTLSLRWWCRRLIRSLERCIVRFATVIATWCTMVDCDHSLTLPRTHLIIHTFVYSFIAVLLRMLVCYNTIAGIILSLERGTVLFAKWSPYWWKWLFTHELLYYIYSINHSIIYSFAVAPDDKRWCYILSVLKA